MSNEELVLNHPRFFRVERCHLGHVSGECPQPPEACDGVYPCWRYDVGVGLTEGRVTWTHGATATEAIDKMAELIRATDSSDSGIGKGTRCFIPWDVLDELIRLRAERNGGERG